MSVETLYASMFSLVGYKISNFLRIKRKFFNIFLFIT